MRIFWLCGVASMRRGNHSSHATRGIQHNCVSLPGYHRLQSSQRQTLWQNHKFDSATPSLDDIRNRVFIDRDQGVAVHRGELVLRDLPTTDGAHDCITVKDNRHLLRGQLAKEGRHLDYIEPIITTLSDCGANCSILLRL